MIASIKIWGLAIAAAVLYGIAQDQVTARVCVEYFTMGHPPVFRTTSPTLLAFGWGIIASWWMGAILGIPLAISAQAGSLPPLSARDLIKPLGILLLIMAFGATVAGVAGFSSAGLLKELRVFPIRLSPDRYAAFSADAFAHQAAYTIGFFGGLGLCLWARRRRTRIYR
jgi:hypothetical protein